MFASRRSTLFWASALALVGAGLLHGCGGAACLRDSDCGSALECREGACQAPLVKGGAVDDAGIDGATSDAATPDASKAGSSGVGTAGGGGEGGGVSGRDSP